MKEIKQIRKRRGLSQRELAAKASISFRGLQMLENDQSDPRLSSLEKIAVALGRPTEGVYQAVCRYLQETEESVETVSIGICEEGEVSWKLWLPEFVDAFRRNPSPASVEMPPVRETPMRVLCLLASTVETLCDETGLDIPLWCGGVGALSSPWFVSGVENLKAMALVESPAHFRKRNIFVLGNFLDRA